MIPPTIQALTAQVRLESGLRNNQVLADTDIYTLIGEAYSDLRDRLIVRFAYWFREEITFNLTSTSPGNIFNLASIPDYQMAQGLDLTVAPGVFYTVEALGSYAERNAFNGTWPFLGMTWGYNGILGRKYWVDGDNLEVLPPQNAAGTYRLVYTPIQTMQPPVALPGSAPVISSFSTNGTTLFTGAAFTAANVGDVLNITGATNAANNGSFTILTVVTANQVVTNNTASVTESPTSATATDQPVGTVGSLPAKLVPWSQYIVLYAAIAVRNSRNQPTGNLTARFNDIKQRVIDLTKQRTEGVRQAPISRMRYGIIGNGFPGSGS